MAKLPEAKDWLNALLVLMGSGAASSMGSTGAILYSRGGKGAPAGKAGDILSAMDGRFSDAIGSANSLGHPFNYDMNYIPGPPQENRMLLQKVADEAILRQTPEEHIAALKRGDEKNLLSWWDEDRPRVNFTPSSSAVSGIRITPDNRIQIRFGRGSKWYSYRGGSTPGQAAIELKKLIGQNGKSIGRALLRNHPRFGQWARDHYLSGY